MKIAIRVDASTQIGSGHVMRCATLARAFREHGDSILFVCRAHQGHMLDFLKADGFATTALPGVAEAPELSQGYSRWLGVSQEYDARDTILVLGDTRPDLLIVDHYALDAVWESALRTHVGNVMAIDDLANRPHDCDLLLDQNFVAGMDRRYDGLLPEHCVRLLGPAYALVRPAFAKRRQVSLERRRDAALERLLIFMGGSDQQNDTRSALEGALASGKPWRHIDIVVGAGYADRASLEKRIGSLANVTLHVQTPHMAVLMDLADLAITSGGSISWEKCTLGLPSIVAIQADNQAPIARALADAGAQQTLGAADRLDSGDYAAALVALGAADLSRMSAAAAAVCDGTGVRVVVQTVRKFNERVVPGRETPY